MLRPKDIDYIIGLIEQITKPWTRADYLLSDEERREKRKEWCDKLDSYLREHWTGITALSREGERLRTWLERFRADAIAAGAGPYSPFNKDRMVTEFEHIKATLLYGSQQGQQPVKPTTRESATRTKRRRIWWTWLKNHPHKYGLLGGVFFLIVFLVAGFLKAEWREWCWGVALLPLLVLVLSLLGGRTRS